MVSYFWKGTNDKQMMLCRMTISLYMLHVSFILVLIRLHAIATHVSEEFIYSHVDQQMRALGLEDVHARDLVHATSDYVELGYGRSTREELGNGSHLCCIHLLLNSCFLLNFFNL